MNAVFKLLSSDDFNGTKCVYAQQTGTDELFMKHANHQKQVLEIVIDKKQLLKIFLKARNIFNQLTNHSLDDIYLASCILLMVTPENQMNTHQDAFLRLLHNDASLLRKEVYFIKALLTSSISRVNKSSKCWLWFKKVYFLFPDKKLFLSTVLESGERHPNNYYCWNFARFLLAVNGEDEVFLNEYYEKTERFCMQHMNDTSAWSFLPLIMTYKVDLFYLREAEGIAQQLKIDLTLQERRYKTPHQRLANVLSWLSRSGAVSMAALFPLLQLGESEQFFASSYFDSMHEFEKRYGPIEIVNGFYRSPSVDQTNALLLEDLKRNGDKKRILQWHRRIKDSLHDGA